MCFYQISINIFLNIKVKGFHLLSNIQILQLVSFAFLMSIGQILFKKTAMSMSSVEAQGLLEGILKALTIPWLYLALITYGMATIFWLYLLQRIPLTIAYPFSALAMIIVPVLAMLIFGESLSFSYWVALILIISGIAIIGY
tara:strand:- start:2143 stop:2568 length:426 start_codon:yes stop_codon:yes gene_type:complete